MKVLLVRPPVPKHTIGLKHIMICEPLELEYIAGNLRRHDVKIFDHLVEHDFDEILDSFRPDVVVSSCYKTGVNEVIKLFRKVKTKFIDCMTVVGGVHATLVPEDFADLSVDVIGIGDGTFLLPEIIDCIEEQRPLLEVPGIALPIAQGLITRSIQRAYMPDPDSLPMPRRDLVAHLKHKYYYLMHQPVATVKTTWGCWYRCNFCFTWKITDGRPYSRSPESIVKEIESIECDDIYIVDDIFLINKSRLRKIADLLKEKGITKKYLVYARADFIADNEEIIKEWSDLGLTAVFVGFEATTNEELSKMNKECDAHKNVRAIEILRKYSIDTYGSLIPDAQFTKADWNRLWQFIEENKLYYVNISPHTPLPGSPSYDMYKEQITVPEDAHGLFDLSHMLLPTKMRIKDYYRELLKLYSKTIFNIRRAAKNTHRTLPSIWSLNYLRVIWGTIKIGKQFYYAHHHHTQKELKIARDKGPEIPDYTWRQKLSRPFYRSVDKKVLGSIAH